MKEEVQKIFLFRELLGTSRNFESSIVLRKRGISYYPISFYEPNMNPNHHGKVIPDTILNKWFGNESLDEKVKSFFKIEKLEDINFVLSEFRKELLKVFNRVDPNSITYLDETISRIRSRLQFIL